MWLKHPTTLVLNGIPAPRRAEMSTWIVCHFISSITLSYSQPHTCTHTLSSSFFYYLSQSPSLSQLQTHSLSHSLFHKNSLSVSLTCKQPRTLTTIAHIWRLSLTLSHSLVLSPPYITTTHATQIHPHTH